MHKIVLALNILILWISLNGQTDIPGTVSTFTKDSIQADFLLQDAYRLLDSMRVDSAMNFFETALQLANEHQNNVLEARALNGIGYVHSIYLSRFDTAQVHMRKAYQLFVEEEQPILAARCLFDLCDVLRSVGQHKEATEVLIESARINEAEGLDSINAGVYYKMAGVFAELGNPEQHDRYLDTAMRIATKYQDLLLLAICNMSLGLNAEKRGQLDSARYFSQLALEIGLQRKDPITIGYAYENLGSVEATFGNFVLAKEYYQKMLQVQNIPPFDRAQFSFFYGDFLLQYNRFNEAKEYLGQALESAKNMEAKPLQTLVMKQLLQLYEKLGEYENAYRMSNQYQHLKDEIRSMKLRIEVEELNLKYETEKKEKAILALQAQNAEQQFFLLQSSAKARQRFWWALTTTLCLLILGGGFYLFFRNSQQQQKLVEKEANLQEQRLHQLQQEQKNLSLRAMLKGEEQERSRVARELHDGIGIILSALKMKLEKIAKASKGDASPSKLVDKASAELRRIAQNMMPETLAKFGLITAIEDLCDEINFSKNLKVTFEHYNLALPLTEKNVALQVYRIIQELLNNVIRHAEATEAFVQIIQSDRLLLLSVEDNGRGFDPSDQLQSGHGLKNINTRINYLNGKLSIDSVQNQGTTTSVEIQLNLQT